MAGGESRQPLLRAEGVTKNFGALRVLEDVDFALSASESVGIVWP